METQKIDERIMKLYNELVADHKILLALFKGSNPKDACSRIRGKRYYGSNKKRLTVWFYFLQPKCRIGEIQKTIFRRTWLQIVYHNVPKPLEQNAQITGEEWEYLFDQTQISDYLSITDVWLLGETNKFMRALVRNKHLMNYHKDLRICETFFSKFSIKFHGR